MVCVVEFESFACIAIMTGESVIRGPFFGCGDLAKTRVCGKAAKSSAWMSGGSPILFLDGSNYHS